MRFITYSVLFCLGLIASANAQAYELDSIKSEAQALDALKQIVPKFQKQSIYPREFPSAQNYIKDSLASKSWFVTDIDNNGENDLLLFGFRGLPEIVLLLSNNGSYTYVESDYSMKYLYVFPRVRKVNGKNILILFSQSTVREMATNSYSMGPVLSDSIEVHDSQLLAYTPCLPKSNPIKRLTIHNNGICEGNCPVIDITLDFTKKTGQFSSYDRETGKTFTQLLRSEIIDNVISILRRFDISSLDRPIRKVGISDLTTITWTFYSGKNKVRRLIDYGHLSNASLYTLYELVCKSTDNYHSPQ